MKSVGIPVVVVVNTGARCTAPDVATYVVNSDPFALVLEHHDLVFRLTTNFRVFPVIDRYLSCFGAVVARHVEYSASCDKL
jgi:hypothetical protein